MWYVLQNVSIIWKFRQKVGEELSSFVCGCSHFFWLCLCPPYSSEKLYNVYNCGGVFSFALFSAKRKTKAWQVHKMITLLAWGKKFSRGTLESALFQTCYNPRITNQSDSTKKILNSLPMSYWWAKYFVIVPLCTHACHIEKNVTI